MDIRHPLGIWIGVYHSASDVKSIYAHLSQAFVTIGQVINTGQLIGKSGNTGNSTGPHLHLGIKDGPYTDTAGQVWQNDHNPWPYLANIYVPPANTSKMMGWLYATSLGIGSDGQASALGALNLRSQASASSIKLGTVPKNSIVILLNNSETNGYRYCECWALPETPVPINIIKGVDNPASDWYWPQTKVVFDTLKSKVYPKFHTSGNNINWYDQYKHPTYNVVRVILNQGFNNPSPQAIFNEIKPDVTKWYLKDPTIRFELFNEPNVEHMHLLWSNGSQFGSTFKQVCQLLKAAYPNIIIYYPGLSPQFGQYKPFLDASIAAGAFDLVNGVCMHSYTGITSNAQTAASVILNEITTFVTRDAANKPVVVSEMSVNAPAAGTYKAQVYKLIWGQVGGIEAAYCFTSSWHPNADIKQEGFLENNIHIELAKII